MVTGGSGSRLVDMLALRPNGLCSCRARAASTSARALLHRQRRQWLPGVADGAYWQLITSAFTHVQLLHIAFNMFALWVFGPQLEMLFGRVRFLALYFICAADRLGRWSLGRPRVQPDRRCVRRDLRAVRRAAGRVPQGPRSTSRASWSCSRINFLITVDDQQHLLAGPRRRLRRRRPGRGAILVYAPRQRRTAYQVAGLVALTAVTVVATWSSARRAQLSCAARSSPRAQPADAVVRSGCCTQRSSAVTCRRRSFHSCAHTCGELHACSSRGPTGVVSSGAASTVSTRRPVLAGPTRRPRPRSVTPRRVLTPSGWRR